MTKIRSLVLAFAWLCAALFISEQPVRATEAEPALVPTIGHRSTVRAVAYSPDDDRVLTGGSDGTMKLWDVETGRLIRTFPAHLDDVTSLAFFADGSRVLSGSGDKTVKVWDVKSGQLLHTFDDHRSVVTSVAVSRDGTLIASGSVEGTVRLWSAVTWKPVHTLTEHKCWVNAVAFSPDGRRVISGGGSRYTDVLELCDDNNLRVWDVATGSLLHTLGHACHVNAVAFSNNGKLIVSGSGNDSNETCADNSLKIWDASSGEILRTIETGYTNKVTSVAFSKDDTRIASGGEHKHDLWVGLDNGVKLWDATTGRLIRTFEGTRGKSQRPSSMEKVPAVALSHDGARLVAIHWSREVKLWDIESGQLIRTFQGRSEGVASLALSPDGKRALSSHGADVRLWDTITGKLLKTLENPARFGIVLSVAFSPDGTHAVVGEWDDITLWDIESGSLIHTFKGHSAEVRSLMFSADGKKVLSAGGDHTAKVWDVQNRSIIAEFSGRDTFSISSAALSHDGTLVLALDNPATLWNVASKELLHTFDEAAATLDSRTVAFSPSDDQLLVPSWNETLRLFDTKSGRLIREFGTHQDQISSVAFSPDGSRLLSASADRTIKVWDVKTGRLIYTLEGQSGTISSVVFSPDGTRVFSGSDDGTIAIWDIDTGKRLATLVPSPESEWLAVTPAGLIDNATGIDQELEFSWIMPDDPLRPQSPEIFLRDYYEPNLLARLSACHDAETTGKNIDACKEAFKPVRSLVELNRIQPDVRIVSVKQGQAPGVVLVEVEVAAKADTSQPNGKTSTGIYDVRLFRNGRLVGQWPEPQDNGVAGDDITSWRLASRVAMAPGKVVARNVFTVRLAASDKSKKVTFTAYGFNEDRVKSATAINDSFTVPEALPAAANPRAYVITVGVNDYDNRALRLNFAVADAEAIRAALQGIQGYDFVPVVLTSDYARKEGNKKISEVDHASKANIRAVLNLLAGKGETERRRLRQEIGPIVDTLVKATPDDMVVLAFSGHGHTRQGRFYILPSDSGKNLTNLGKLISSEELAAWLRDVDAGEMVMIVDACHSAAGVPEGFKPGPMGDRGLGQLAYDKGMRILAATQASDVALESGALGQGLLTYALKEGLSSMDGKVLADADDNGVTLKEWLTYAERRVPGLYQDVLAGKIRKTKDSSPDLDLIEDVTRYAQTPVLFDFARGQDQTIVLRK
ncbi:MAG: caspase family protein [Parvibaculaceae bacterium]